MKPSANCSTLASGTPDAAMPQKRFITIGDRTMRLCDWAREAGITPGCLHARLRLGIPPEIAVRPGDGRSREEVRFQLSEARRGNLNPMWRGGATPEKKAAYGRAWRKRNEGRVRDREYKKRFGITLDEYERMLAAQGGLCAVCGGRCRRGRLSVDHCHKTGRVRGLLCRSCNIILGLMQDNPEWLRQAEVYLAGKIAISA